MTSCIVAGSSSSSGLIFLVIFAMWIRPGFLSKFSCSNLVEVRMLLFGLADVLVDPPVAPSVADLFSGRCAGSDSLIDSLTDPLADSWSLFAVDSCNKI